MFEQLRIFKKKSPYERMVEAGKNSDLVALSEIVGELRDVEEAGNYYYTLKSLLYTFADKKNIYPYSAFTVKQSDTSVLIRSGEMGIDLSSKDKAFMQVTHNFDDFKGYSCSILGKAFTNDNKTKGCTFEFLETDGNEPYLHYVLPFEIIRGSNEAQHFGIDAVSKYYDSFIRPQLYR